MKNLPKGAWLYCPSISPETTEEKLRDFLADRGVDVPIECVSINAAHTSAMVCIDNECAAILANWATNCAPLDGRTISFAGWHTPPLSVPAHQRGSGHWHVDE